MVINGLDSGIYPCSKDWILLDPPALVFDFGSLTLMPRLEHFGVESQRGASPLKVAHIFQPRYQRQLSFQSNPSLSSSTQQRYPAVTLAPIMKVFTITGPWIVSREYGSLTGHDLWHLTTLGPDHVGEEQTNAQVRYKDGGEDARSGKGATCSVFEMLNLVLGAWCFGGCRIKSC